MKYLFFAFTLSIVFSGTSQELTGNELLDKAIAYHDPEKNWASFNDQFTVTMQTSNSSDRVTDIYINLPSNIFKATAKKDSIITTYYNKNGKCITTMADSLRIANLPEPPKRSHCETTELYKNYYTYLYGLPMKLKDPGTNIHEKIERKTFKGKEYLVLKATYDKAVGSDVWYFYFNTKTYAMEIYQFFKTDDSGKLKPDSGEYILLTEEAIVNTIKMPKNRAWYYNKDDKYLGTDLLKQ